MIDKALVSDDAAFRMGRVAERDDRLRRLARYYRAHISSRPFPEVRCNAPWASAVVEADGTLRPCFFQPAVGNVRERGLGPLLDDEMVRFRRGLDVARDATCQRCVCSLRVGLRARIGEGADGLPRAAQPGSSGGGRRASSRNRAASASRVFTFSRCIARLRSTRTVESEMPSS